MVLATDFLRQMDAPLPVSILCSNKQQDEVYNSGGGGNAQLQSQGQGQGSGSNNMSIEQQVILHSYTHTRYMTIHVILE